MRFLFECSQFGVEILSYASIRFLTHILSYIFPYICMCKSLHLLNGAKIFSLQKLEWFSVCQSCQYWQLLKLN